MYVLSSFPNSPEMGGRHADGTRYPHAKAYHSATEREWPIHLALVRISRELRWVKKSQCQKATYQSALFFCSRVACKKGHCEGSLRWWKWPPFWYTCPCPGREVVGPFARLPTGGAWNQGTWNLSVLLPMIACESHKDLKIKSSNKLFRNSRTSHEIRSSTCWGISWSTQSLISR